MGFKYIIVIIDTFVRHVELYSKQEVTAIAAAGMPYGVIPVHSSFGYCNGFRFAIYEPIAHAL